MKKVIFTIVSNNYLGSALALYDSVLEHCKKDVDFLCLISDQKDPNINYEKFGFKVIWPEDFLNKEIILEMAFKYDVVEFNTALKPFAIMYLMHSLGYERVFYFDPDTYLFDGIENIEKKLEEKDIVVTPHIVDGIYGTGLKENEEAILRNGIYNLGFFGVNRTYETEQLIKWWMDKLRNQCYDNKSYFVDQKWMNFITAYSDSVCVLKSKVYNVAKWNHHERKISIINNKFYVEKEKLCFFHFSGYKAGSVNEFIEREFPYSEDKEVLNSLFVIYQQELKKNHFDEYRRIPYVYNFYDNGMVISRLNRRLYRQMLEEGLDFANPFETDVNSFYTLMKKNGLLSNVYRVNELKSEVSKADNKQQFQNILNAIMKIALKVLGARRYELLLGYFYNYCTIDNQRFLINDKKV